MNKVYEVLDKLGVQYEQIEHPALFVAGDEEKYGLKFDGVVLKNLFLRNQNKSKHYLVSLPLHKRADLKLIQEKLQETKLSFGSEERLYEKLKITSGSVSLLNIVEVEKTDIKFIIDKSILNAEKIGIHPNINTATVLCAPDAINKILQHYNAEYEFIEL